MDFADVARKVINLYYEAAYDEALATVRRARTDFRDEDSTLTWYEGCLLGISRRPEEALAVLESGLDRGLGWHPKMLLDTDLDTLRTLDGWDAFETRSADIVASWEVVQPPPFVREPAEPTGTLIGLHGGGGDPRLFFDFWDSATPPQWSVVVPVGGVPVSKVEWAWPFDLETDSLVELVGELPLTKPIVLSGFSQGGRLAAKAAWDGDIDVAGLVTFAAGLTPDAWTSSRRVPVPVYAVVGTEDRALEGCLDAETVLREHKVPIHLDVQRGLGHQLPEDLPTVMEAGLGWLTGLPQAR